MTRRTERAVGLLIATSTGAAPSLPAAAAAEAVAPSALSRVTATLLSGLDSAAERVGELWRGFAGVPDDVLRLASLWRAAQDDSDALRAAIYGLILLLIGAAIEWLYWCYAFSVRRMIEATTPRSPGHAAALAIGRFALELTGIALFFGAVLAASAGFAWRDGVQEIVITLALAVTLVRIVAAASHMLLARRISRLRMVELTDGRARRLNRVVVVTTMVVVLGWLGGNLLRTALGAEHLAVVLRLVAATCVVGMLIATMLNWSPPAASDDAVAAGDRRSAALLRFGAVVILVSSYLVWIAGFDRLAWTAVILGAFLVADWVGRHILDRIARPGEAAAAGPPGLLDAYRPVFQRVIHLALAAIAIMIAAPLWGLPLAFLTDGAPPAARAAGGIVSVGVTMLLADLCWVWVKTLIDLRLQRGASSAAGVASSTRLNTLLPLLRKFLIVILLLVIALTALSAIGVEIAPLLAGAGIVGIAIGFGSQTLVKDIISGVFFLLDDAFRVGEYIESGSIRGTVENFSLRSIKLRHHRGALHTVPFGELRSITNFSRDWVIDKLTFGVTYDTDLDKVKKIIKQVSKELMDEPELAQHILEPLKSQGVAALGDYAIQIRLKVKTVPGEQFVVRRTVYDKIKKAFAVNGIRFAFPTVTVEGRETGDAAAAQMALENLRPDPKTP